MQLCVSSHRLARLPGTGEGKHRPYWVFLDNKALEEGDWPQLAFSAGRLLQEWMLCEVRQSRALAQMPVLSAGQKDELYSVSSCASASPAACILGCVARRTELNRSLCGRVAGIWVLHFHWASLWPWPSCFSLSSLSPAPIVCLSCLFRMPIITALFYL